MRTVRWVAALACLSLTAVAPGAGQTPPREVTLDVILARAAVYVSGFMSTFVDVVAEERYVQQAQGRTTLSRAGRSAMATSALERRELLSDFLLVKVQGANVLVPFRDVFEADGGRVRDRE